ncbi:MAG: hypothetical protein J6S85_03985 [Methanobrevibacter sp.]|nr:hypothetical protein [Methanobrevibacter sp.]MBO7712703.1 hypothetical protein [Methanobrevibacter sp.]
MTKTLTEKWKDGELPSSDDEHNWLSYYIMFKDGSTYSDSYWRGQWGTADRNYIKEVLAPVLTYDEYKDIEKGYIELCRECRRLQEQLKEANELLKEYGTESLWESLSLSCDEAYEYCKKWGVK